MGPVAALGPRMAGIAATAAAEVRGVVITRAGAGVSWEAQMAHGLVPGPCYQHGPMYNMIVWGHV